MCVVSKEEKVFKHYEEMPSEVRFLVIDEMEPLDRIKFSTCSKLSNTEAKQSKNYIYSLHITSSHSLLRIEVIHVNHVDKKKRLGFWLIFDNGLCRRGKWIGMVHMSSGKILWQAKLGESMNMFECGAIQFQHLLKIYQARIRQLIIREPDFSKNLKIDSLKSLEILAISVENSLKILRKTRKPLGALQIIGEDNSPNPQLLNYVFKVRHNISMKDVKLNDEQFLQLRAPVVEMNIGYLTEKGVFNFIRSWQNAELGFSLRNYTWFTNDSSFSVRGLMHYLGAPKHNFKRMKRLKIWHNKEKEKFANLSFSSETGKLTFSFEEPSRR